MYSIFKRICNEKGLTPTAVGRAVGVSSATLAAWKSGEYTPKFEKIKKLADYLGIPVSILLGEAPTPTTDHTMMVPVLGRVAAGIPSAMIEEVIDYEEISQKDGEYFALQINGDSMFPRIQKGDIVIVRRQEDVESGDVAIVSIGGEDATCKKILKDEGGITLVSYNAAYDPRRFTNDQIATLPVVLLGKVIELRGKF